MSVSEYGLHLGTETMDVLEYVVICVLGLLAYTWFVWALIHEGAESDSAPWEGY